MKLIQKYPAFGKCCMSSVLLELVTRLPPAAAPTSGALFVTQEYTGRRHNFMR